MKPYKAIENYLNRLTKQELEDFEKIVKDFNEQQKTKLVYPILLNKTAIGGGSFEQVKKDVENRLKMPNADRQTIINDCRNRYVKILLADKNLKRIYEEIRSARQRDLTGLNKIEMFMYFTDKHRIEELIKIDDYLKDLETGQEPIKNNSTTPPEKEYKALIHCITVVLEYKAENKPLPLGRRTTIEQLAGKRTKYKKSKNQFYQEFGKACNLKLSNESNLINEIGENWKEIVLSLSEKPIILKEYIEATYKT